MPLSHKIEIFPWASQLLWEVLGQPFVHAGTTLPALTEEDKLALGQESERESQAANHIFHTSGLL